MVNFGLNSASILGIFLAVAGAGLYFMRSVRPELSRDHDIFFAAVGLLCGFILLFQGWRLDPILQFGQFLLTGTTIFFAVETIRLRQATTEQERRNSPFVDDERKVSRTRAYTESDLEQIEPEEEEELYPPKRRLRGSDYEGDQTRTTRTRRPSRPSPSNERYNRYPEETSRNTRRVASEKNRSDYWDDRDQDWEQEPKRPKRRDEEEEKTLRSSKKTRNYSNEYGDEPAASYVDYQHIDNISDSSKEKPENQPKPNRDYDEDSSY